ncbi:MAG: sodium:proton antiporter [Planctomycetaceae bacterium]|jgi:Na+/H+ antiporter NhaD/arsenite permease-like protein|nr:sodium:proton antiporter [Planctomycetaceae bacterium]
MAHQHDSHDHSHNHTENPPSGSVKPVALLLLAVFVFYVILLGMRLPQSWTTNSLSHSHGESPAATSEIATLSDENAQNTTIKMTEAESVAEHSHDHTEHENVVHEHAKQSEKALPPAMYAVFPFVFLLLCIAILPLVPATSHWWEHNSSKFLVAASLGMITLLYYMFVHHSPVEAHWAGHIAAGNAGFQRAWTVFENAIIGEYISFIVLLFALYTIAGGIRIEGDLRAKPITNTIIMAIGAVFASFIGTTGAAMLLIRLLLETNKERKNKTHTVIFFIFIVCNCGGLLTPLGDPPLFLGFLKGVKFEYTLLNLWPEWLFVNGLLLVIYFLWDTLFAYPREPKENIQKDTMETTPLRIQGVFPNVFLLIGVVLTVLFLDPSKAIGGWHPWYYSREIAQLGLVFLSLTLGNYAIRITNKFSYAAIIEVAALFFGIFICMQAPIQILNVYGPKLGIDTSHHFFWAAGALSSFLDNAPTYVVFFETALSLGNAPANAIDLCGVPINPAFLAAISLGAVMMGAMTYIGNGPNFMVKAIAEETGVKMPSFFGYMLYSCLVLLPILFIMTMIFLR